MNANTALKINDAVDQAVRCGESLDSIRVQVERAIDRAVEAHRPTLHFQSRFVVVRTGHVPGIGDYSVCDTEQDDKVLYQGTLSECSAQAAWFARDALITKATGIAPGETLRIDV